MFAVVATGGKQYKVKPGDIIRVEALPGAIGDPVDFDQVLLVASDDGTVATGRPYVAGSHVFGRIHASGHSRKVVTIKLRRRKNSRRKAGHRQPFSDIAIDRIETA
ncbi:Ribosomal protein L21 [mine drainage metagenome]|uniref:Ribosomal protein L21 n=1 Tax=mine drainage metagenome TaxID=410659 RepID=T1BSZ0_9ZZZZ